MGKPRTTGKKPKRKGILKRSGAHIRIIIAVAETSGMEWQVRGCHETQLESDDSEHMDELSDFESSSSCQPVTTPSSAETMAQDEAFGQNQSVTCTAGTFVVIQSDVQNINFRSICGTTRAPPPLIPAILQPMVVSTSYATSSSTGDQDQRPGVDMPFWLAFIFGNVSRCNGCKGKIAQDANNKV